jgi:hypothetical protein
MREGTQLHTSSGSTSARSHDRDAYAEVARAWRYSSQRLYAPETPHDTRTLRSGGGSVTLAHAVHNALLGQLLAGYSRLSEARRYPLWTVTTLVGLDVESASDRKRVQRCAKWLAEIGALHYTPAMRRGDSDLIALPEPPDDWHDATTGRAPDGAEVAPERGESCTAKVPELHREGAIVAPLSEELSEEQSEQASESVRERDPNGSPARPHSPNGKPKQRPETARATERESDNPRADTGMQPEDVARAETLAGLLPQPVKAKADGGTATLAAAILSHGKPEHAAAIRKLRTWLDAGATRDLARFLDGKAKQLPPDTRSLAGLVLKWLSDLDPTPPHEPKHYRYGFPFRDALRAGELSGLTGVLRLGTFALAAEAVLDAGHDPVTDPDGFLAVLAATVLPFVPERGNWRPDVDPRPLEAFAGNASPVPWTLPDAEVPDDASPRGTSALDVVGLAGTDPRRVDAWRDPNPTRANAGGWR